MTDSPHVDTFEKIDVHTHLGDMPNVHFTRSRTDLEAVERSFGITRAVCSSARAVFYEMKGGNAAMYEAVQASELLYMYVYVDPLRPEVSLRELETYARLPRVAGIKSRPEYHRVAADHPAYVEICGRAAQLKLPYLMHTWSPQDVAGAIALTQKVSLPIILAHVVPRGWSECVQPLKDFPNLILDPCSSYQEYNRLRYLVDLVGPERVVLGTDSTLITPAWTLGAFESAGLNDREKRLIYRENALRIFGERLQ